MSSVILILHPGLQNLNKTVISSLLVFSKWNKLKQGSLLDHQLDLKVAQVNQSHFQKLPFEMNKPLLVKSLHYPFK